MFRAFLRALGALLLLFHAWLLAGDAWTGQLFEPDRLLRWLIAAGLGAAFIALRRRGASLFFGRRAVVIWLLAALLHGPAIAERFDPDNLQTLPPAVMTLAQVTLVAAAAGLGLLLCLCLHLARRRFQPDHSRSRTSIDSPQIDTISPRVFLHLASRPPPTL